MSWLSSRVLSIFYLLSVVSTVTSTGGSGPTVSWSLVKPRGQSPPQVNEPSVIALKERYLVVFNGVQDNCNTGITTGFDNRRIYVYDTKYNKAWYATATGDIPDERFFALSWKSGERSATMGGGVFYNVDFSIIDFKSLGDLYELRMSSDFRSGTWTHFVPGGPIPAASAELGIVQDPNNPNFVYLYGGVALTNTGFRSQGSTYRYIVNQRRYELLDDIPVPDVPTPGQPLSRYHAHTYLGKEYHSEQFLEIHQGDHSTPEGESIELTDSWRFNIASRSWTEIFPHPQISLIRRSGVDFQFDTDRGQYFCTALGDLIGEDQRNTIGCAFDLTALLTVECSNPKSFNSNGSWRTIQEKAPRGAIYPGYTKIDDRVYIVGGTREIPINATDARQFFNRDILVMKIRH